jgi:hypothetical protein
MTFVAGLRDVVNRNGCASHAPGRPLYVSSFSSFHFDKARKIPIWQRRCSYKV